MYQTWHIKNELSLPFNQLYYYKVIAISSVVQDEPIWWSGLKLEEQVHGVIGLQGGQGHIARARLEGNRICHDAPVADHGVQFAVVNVAVLAQVNVGHAIEGQTLQVSNEVGGHGGHVPLLCNDARLHIVELQLRVVPRDLTLPRRIIENRFNTGMGRVSKHRPCPNYRPKSDVMLNTYTVVK